MFRLVAVALVVAACGGSKSKPATTSNDVAKDDPQDICVQSFTRARTCTTEYIPALVDSRARHDVPPGIAKAVQEDRNAVIAEAMKEWENDSKDDAIAANCQKMSGDLPADMVAEAKGCLAAADCAAFTACEIPVLEKHLSKQH